MKHIFLFIAVDGKPKNSEAPIILSYNKLGNNAQTINWNKIMLMQDSTVATDCLTEINDCIEHQQLK